jgi:hypothetical protein
MKISRIMFIVMLFLFSCSMVAFSQDMEAAEMEKSNSGIQLGKAIVVTATVEAINANERKVVLRSDSGKVQVVEVGPEVKNFEQP